MTRTLLRCALFVVLSTLALADVDSNTLLEETKPDPRTFFVVDLGQSTSGSQTVTSSTALNTTLLGYALLGLILFGTIAALIAYYFTSLGAAAPGAGGDFFGRSLPGQGIEYQNLNILDWIAMAEDAWRNYDTSNPDCYKRILCEVFENKKLDGVARSIDGAAKYATFLEIFRFSRLFNEMFDDARVAIESGKSQEKCAYLYDTCDFSLNHMMSKYMDYNDISSNPDQDVEYLKK